jgi:flagellar biosynthesis protein FliR
MDWKDSMVVSVPQAQIFFLALTRILAIIVQLPYFGSQIVPNQYKLALGVVLAMIVIPWEPLPADAQIMPFFEFAFAVLQELMIGLLAGFAATLTFGAFQMVGKVLELGSGFGSGQIFNPTLGDVGSAYDQLFLIVVMIYFLLTNGHHIFLMGLKATFNVLPVHSPFPSITIDRLLYYLSSLMTSAIQMALPVMAALFLTDMTLGLLARVAPQIQVFFLGLPVKIWIALIALALSFEIILPFAGNAIENIGKRMLGLLGA